MEKGDIMLIITLAAIIFLGWMALKVGGKKKVRKVLKVGAKDYINMFNNNKGE